jgi:hypothetical protein
VGKRDGSTGHWWASGTGPRAIGGQAGRVHGPRSGLGEAEGPSAPADPSRFTVGKRGGGARLLLPDEAAKEVGEVGDGRGFGAGDLGLFVVAAEAEGGFPVGAGPEGGLLLY